MKKLFLSFALLCVCTLLQAQIAYTYDAAGNRITRRPVLQQPTLPDEATPEEASISISVYPSPTNGPFTLTITGLDGTTANASGSYPITITDAYGTPVVNTTAHAAVTQLDITSQRSGYYLVYVTINGERYCQKVIRN